MQETSSKPIASLTEAFAPLRPAFVGVGMLSFVSNLLVFTSPIYSLQVYDRVLSSRNATTLALITALVVGLYLAYAALEHYRSRALTQISAVLDEKLSGRAFDVALMGALRVRTAHHAQALRDADTVRDFVGSGAVLSLMDAPWTFVFIALCFVLHVEIGLFALAAAGTLLVLSVANEILTRKALTDSARVAAGALDRLSASLRNAETIRALGMTATIRERWYAGHRRSLAASVEAGERGGTIVALIKFLRLTVQSCVLGLGAWLVIRHELSAGAMFATSIVLGRALAPIEAVVGQWKSVVAVRNSWKRLDHAIRTAPRPDERMTFPRPRGAILVEALVVAPPGTQRPVVKGVSLDIPPGEVLAIIGKTGSGKSSFARALIGAWPATSGTVRFDGNDIANHDPDQIGRFVGYLPQDVELFAGTVGENIARLAEVADEAVMAAAQAAHAHEMIQRLEAGYDTQIGEDGVGLSGGQRQRVALARAVFGEPAIVMLDEPNSNLDGDGDASLAATIRALKAKGVTVIVVTHKADILAVCDRIAIMNDGVIVRCGPRDEILSALSGGASEARPMARVAGVRA